MFEHSYLSGLALPLLAVAAAILLFYSIRKRGDSRHRSTTSADAVGWTCSDCGHTNEEKRTHCSKCGNMNPRILISEKIGKYKILRLMHTSAFVDIFLGYNEDNLPTWENHVVIKKAKQAYSTILKEQMRNEARILSLLKCVYAPRYVGWDQEEEEYVVMEHLEGKNLDKIGKLRRNELIDMTLELADAIESIQMDGIVHRDFKPGNVMVGDRVALIDFSISGIIGEKGKDKCMPAGTPFYSPPESEKAICNPENDIYGLGATIFYMLTGRDPELGKTSRLEGEEAVLMELSEKCMKRKPSDRPFVDDIREAVGRMERRPRVFVQGKTHFLERDTTTVGISQDSDIRIEDEHGRIAGKHVEIRKENGKWIIVDRESRNGTYVKRGDEFVAIEEGELSDGSYVSLGFHPFRGPHIALRFRGGV